jgi:RNA polymerase sigma-70 factor (ECF subfamily)
MSTKTSTDETLLLDFRQTREESLFEEIVARYRDELLGYLIRQLRDREIAEDALQQVFVKVFRKCDQFEESRRFRPWIYRIARNQSIDSRRREQRHAHIRLDEPESTCDNEHALVDIIESSVVQPAAATEQREQYERSREAVEGLPQRLREPFNLVYRDQLKYSDAAEVLSVPLGTIKSRMHCALSTLRSVLNASQPAGAA